MMHVASCYALVCMDLSRSHYPVSSINPPLATSAALVGTE